MGNNNNLVPGFNDEKDDSLKINLEKLTDVDNGLIVYLSNLNVRLIDILYHILQKNAIDEYEKMSGFLWIDPNIFRKLLLMVFL